MDPKIVELRKQLLEEIHNFSKGNKVISKADKTLSDAYFYTAKTLKTQQHKKRNLSSSALLPWVDWTQWPVLLLSSSRMGLKPFGSLRVELEYWLCQDAGKPGGNWNAGGVRFFSRQLYNCPSLRVHSNQVARLLMHHLKDV